MKVGLIPLLYNEHNYGGVLQFYALQNILGSNGIKTDIVYFRNNEIICEKSKKLTNCIRKLKVIAYNAMHFYDKFILVVKTKHRNRKIDLFKKKYYSQVVDEKKILFDEYDAFICGSDQIWNPQWAKKRSFLLFVPDRIKKIIYGASLGCELLSEQEKSVYKPAIERLQYVSVRENSAKQILDSFIDNINIQVVLDPTLLLSPDEWDLVIKPSSEQKYVFTYFLGEYKYQKESISNFARKNGLKIINIPFASGETVDKNCFGDRQILDADPGEFLGLIKGADYIFTDSFHACVFSILFKKPFFIYRRDNNNKMIGRIETLLEYFGLNIEDVCFEKNTDIHLKLNFDRNDEILKNLRKKSIDYLIGSIKKGNKKTID